MTDMTQEELNNKCTLELMADLLESLRGSFAHRSDAFFKILANRLKEREYNGRQLKRGIHRVIETCSYNQLSISDVLSCCDAESSERFVVYEVFMPNKSWQTVTHAESAYKCDCEMYLDENTKPRLIKYID